MVPRRRRPAPGSPDRRLAAAAALVTGAAAVVVGFVSIRGDLLRATGLALVLVVAVVAAWTAVTHRGAVRWVAAALGGAGLLLCGVVTLTAEWRGLGMAAVAALAALSVGLSHRALTGAIDGEGVVDAVPVPAARHGVVIVNPRSGGGKAERWGLEEACHRRGIETIALRPGDDLRALAQDAIDRGADALGMAGGDGSQALVASVATAADVAVVCIPAGTRNHFALDLGLDRTDVLGALDAFDDAVERRIDLATVGGRVFVNNVSLGVYAEIVRSPEYREAKSRTTAALLPEMLGPDVEPFDLRFPGPDGSPWVGAHVVQVSNNPYVLTRRAGFGGRPRLDSGRLGIAVVTVSRVRRTEGSKPTRIGRRPEVAEWTAPTFVVHSDQPIPAGVDGEALLLSPPLSFAARPGALRVRLPRSAPGRSPAADAGSLWGTARALVRIVRSTPSAPALTRSG